MAIYMEYPTPDKPYQQTLEAILISAKYNKEDFIWTWPTKHKCEVTSLNLHVKFAAYAEYLFVIFLFCLF